MSPHDESYRIRHMLDHAVEAVALIQGRTRESLDSDRQFNLALVRLVEIIGEAANRVKPETREQNPETRGSRSSACATE